MRSVAELGLAFSRVARAVRQTLALEARLEDDRAARDRAGDSAQGWTLEAHASAAATVRARLARIIAAANDEESDDADDDENRAENLSDSIERPDWGEDGTALGDRPPGEVVAAVCADLGLERDLSLWADEPAPPTQTPPEPTANPEAPAAPSAPPVATNDPPPDSG